ncbi:MAG: TetR/AcrR family transcriptional regulator [Polyangiaceae bacterium]|nr:TetR/AcrR family transcriptional regulator [Polyangiaceae bacterium]
MPKTDATKPRKRPRQARSKVTVDAILTAAARILVDVGYDRANVNEIARRAGVSIGSLYQYYPTKEALMNAVVERHAQTVLAAFQDGLPDFAQLPPRDAVRAVVRRGLAVFATDPSLRRVIREVPKLSGATASPDWDESFEIAIAEFIRYHRAAFRPKSVDDAAKIVRVAVESIAISYAADAPEKLKSEALVAEVLDMVERYLLVDR